MPKLRLIDNVGENQTCKFKYTPPPPIFISNWYLGSQTGIHNAQKMFLLLSPPRWTTSSETTKWQRSSYSVTFLSLRTRNPRQLNQHIHRMYTPFMQGKLKRSSQLTTTNKTIPRDYPKTTAPSPPEKELLPPFDTPYIQPQSTYYWPSSIPFSAPHMNLDRLDCASARRHNRAPNHGSRSSHA